MTQHSAVPAIYSATAVSIDANHMDMTKFSSVEDSGFISLKAALIRIMKGKVGSVRKAPIPASVGEEALTHNSGMPQYNETTAPVGATSGAPAASGIAGAIAKALPTKNAQPPLKVLAPTIPASLQPVIARILVGPPVSNVQPYIDDHGKLSRLHVLVDEHIREGQERSLRLAMWGLGGTGSVTFSSRSQ